jgi:hypothetical protein
MMCPVFSPLPLVLRQRATPMPSAVSENITHLLLTIYAMKPALGPLYEVMGGCITSYKHASSQKRMTA